MITIEHTPRGGCNLTLPNPLEYSDDTLLYFTGHAMPNFPVPAIRYHVDRGRTGVAIWNDSKPYTDADYYTMQPEFELLNPDYL